MPNISSADASPAGDADANADADACRAALRTGSRTFFAASWVLPSAVRANATALYAFCRLADDAIDQGADGGEALRALHARLDLIYQRRPANAAADRAFAETVARYAIPKAIPAALFEGFAWDAQCRRYENFSQLLDYAVRVAGTVGLMMSMIMGVKDRELLTRACDLGVAMQLTNIARDVGEDARNGRLYLPLQWMREAHLDPQAWLAHPVFDESLAGVVQRLLEAADVFYRRSESGLCRLPRACRPGMFAARMLYAEIGREVERRHFDSVSQRATVSVPRKLAVLSRALLTSLASLASLTSVASLTSWATQPAASDGEQRLPEADFLMGRINLSPERRAAPRRLAERLIWVIDLFERLERSERGELRAAP